MTSPKRRSGAAASPAKTLALRDVERALLARARASRSPSSTSSAPAAQKPSSSKTSRASSARMPVAILGHSPVGWQNSGMGGPTGFLTLSSSECPSDDDGCSCSRSTLTDILEPSAPPRYFLSARAAMGIMRRAKRRGLRLPAALSAALAATVASRYQLRSRGAEPRESTAPSPKVSSSARSRRAVSSGTRTRTRRADTSSPPSVPAEPDTPSAPTTKDDSSLPRPSIPATGAKGATTPDVTSSVRRLTPLEEERLMGWPDGWTIAPWPVPRP